jgi:hypothetical protein
VPAAPGSAVCSATEIVVIGEVAALSAIFPIAVALKSSFNQLLLVTFALAIELILMRSNKLNDLLLLGLQRLNRSSVASCYSLLQSPLLIAQAQIIGLEPQRLGRATLRLLRH